MPHTQSYQSIEGLIVDQNSTLKLFKRGQECGTPHRTRVCMTSGRHAVCEVRPSLRSLRSQIPLLYAPARIVDDRDWHDYILLHCACNMSWKSLGNIQLNIMMWSPQTKDGYLLTQSICFLLLRKIIHPHPTTDQPHPGWLAHCLWIAPPARHTFVDAPAKHSSSFQKPEPVVHDSQGNPGSRSHKAAALLRASTDHYLPVTRKKACTARYR